MSQFDDMPVEGQLFFLNLKEQLRNGPQRELSRKELDDMMLAAIAQTRIDTAGEAEIEIVNVSKLRDLGL